MFDPDAELRGRPLKTLEPASLALAVQAEACHAGMPVDRLNQAMAAAAYLHRDQMRMNRLQFPTTPYIEHPLRNALRLLRWGVEDETTCVAAVLHDVAEDCAGEVSRLTAAETGSDEGDRAECLRWISETFGSECGRIVEAVSNPLAPEDAGSKAERYRKHVAQAVRGDGRVCLVKWADYVDNAGSLHHHFDVARRDSVARRARKYVPLAETFRVEFREAESFSGLVSAEQLETFEDMATRIESRLLGIVGGEPEGRPAASDERTAVPSATRGHYGHGPDMEVPAVDRGRER